MGRAWGGLGAQLGPNLGQNYKAGLLSECTVTWPCMHASMCALIALIGHEAEMQNKLTHAQPLLAIHMHNTSIMLNRDCIQ